MRLLKTILLSQLFVVGFTFSQEANGSNPEILNERDMFSRTYLQSSGLKEKVISPGPLNYFVNGEWKDVNTEIVLRGGDYINATNVIKSTFPNQVNNNSWIYLDHEGSVISMSTLKTQVLYSDLSGLTYYDTWQGSSASTNGNTLTYANVANGISDQYEIASIGVKNSVILSNTPSIIANANTGYYGYQEEMVLPEGWSLVYETESSSGLITSAIILIDENEEPQLMIDAPVFFDDNGLTDGETYVEGKYILEEVQGIYKLTTLVPVYWLKDQTRTYPVTLDPSVQLFGTTGGWMSTVNLVNNPYYTFLGVCCGNQEHRAWIKFNTASIPDNSCIDKVELQVFVNGVGASTAELVHVTAIMGAGQWGPYPGISAAVLTDLADGIYTSFTITGTGYYGYYDLGAAAAADLQSLLPVDLYEIGMIFDNEPSTAWKRITADASDLRITYSAPPCLILPVELTEFKAECQEDKTKLTWTTASENLNDHFTVWRSFDGNEFEPILDVDGMGTSQELTTYEAYDDTRGSVMAYYKLSQTDMDGQTLFYNAVSFNGCDLEESHAFSDPSGYVHVKGVEIDYVILSDHLGRQMEFIQNKEDKTSIVFDPSVDTGTYIVTIIHKNGNIESRKIFLK